MIKLNLNNQNQEVINANKIDIESTPNVDWGSMQYLSSQNNFNDSESDKFLQFELHDAATKQSVRV